MTGVGRVPSVITGQDLKDIRARSGLGNQQLAELLDESLSTVNRWLANGVRVDKEAKVRERLARWMPPTEPDRYTQMSDAALLADIIRLLGIVGQRLAERDLSRGGDDALDDTPTVLQITPDSGTNSQGGPGRRQAPGQGFAAEPTRRRRRRDNDARTED